MKKALTLLAGIAALSLAALCLNGCKGVVDKSAPAKKVVETAVKALKNGDIKAYVDTYDLSQEAKDQLTSLLETKIKPEMDKTGGIKDYKIEQVSFDDEAGTAVYNVTLTYADGTTKDQKVDLIKTADGWKQKLNK